MDGHDPAEGHWWYPDDYPGEAATVAGADAGVNFHDMFGNSTEDLFKLEWEGGTAGQQAVSSSILSLPPPLNLPRVSLELSPSNDVMAAWLYPIVSGETAQAGDGTKVTSRVKSEPETASMMATASLGTMTAESKGKLPATEVISGAKNTDTRRKAAPGGSSKTTRSSHYSGTHNMTEKRRRCKISDRLRTLQQLVPGCDKSNQTSTLEQTIQYMKSLQQQVQAMNMMPVASTAAAMVYPVVQPAARGHVVRPGPLAPMVQYGTMLPYAHYHAVMMSAAGSAVPVMTPVRAPDGQCSISREQQQHKKEKGERRL